MVWVPAIAAGISALGSIGGGLLSGSSAKKASKKANKLAKKQLKWQKYVDTHRIQMTVADAKAAGIHPLAALGASGLPQSSPVTVQPSYGGGFDWGDAIGAGTSALSQGLMGLYDEWNADEAKAKEEARYQQQRRDEMYYRGGETARADAMLQMQEKAARLNERLIESQLEEAQSRTRLNNMRAAAVGGPTVDQNGARVYIDPFGNKIEIAPTTDAQTWSDRYGDIAGEIFGAGNFIRDLFFDDPGT